MPLEEVKVCLVGKIRSGKTSLVQKLTSKTFSGQYHPTLGINSVMYVRMKMQLCDISGQAEAEPMLLGHLKRLKANAIVICCDLTRRESFNGIKNWHTHVSALAPDTPIFLIGTKMDATEHQTVTLTELKEKAAELNLHGCYFTSAKTGKGVTEAFDDIAKKISPQPAEDATPAATSDNSNLTVENLKKTYTENGGGWLAKQLIFGWVFQNTQEEVVRKLKERAADHLDGASAQTLGHYTIPYNIPLRR